MLEDQCVTQKETFETMAEALRVQRFVAKRRKRRAARHVDHGPVALAYQCALCGKYHLGRRGK